MADANSTSIAIAVISGVVGGSGVAILNYILNRKKTETEIQKMRAETDKINAEIKNLSATVSYSLSDSAEQIIFDGKARIDGFDIKGAEGQFWTGIGKDAKTTSPKGHGTLRFEEGGILNIQRTNIEGRFELWLQRYFYNRKEHAIIPKDELISGKRKLRVSCEAKAVGGEHTLRFVVREVRTGLRLADEAVRVKGNVWTPFQVYLLADPAQECQLRIDDEQVSIAPSSVQIRNLVVTERK